VAATKDLLLLRGLAPTRTSYCNATFTGLI